MRKSYILTRLGLKVQRLAAIMLVTLLAVGNVLAEEVTFVFSEQGYENAEVITGGTINNYITFTADKGGATNTPKYYTSGAAIRLYPGNGNGNVFTLTPATGYQITGVTVNENSSNTGAIGFIVDGGAAVVVNPTDNACSISGVAAVSSLKFYNAVNSASGHIRISSITISYSEAGAAVVSAPTFSVPSGTYYTTQTISLACETQGASIYYSINGSTPVLYNAPFTLDATATVAAYATLGGETSSTVSKQYTFPVFVNNIAAYYAASDATLVNITGDLTFVYRNGRYVYVKDATGGLLIFDSSNPVITTAYNEGDVFTGGVVGTRSIYNGLDELVPSSNTAAASATETVTPVEVTAAQLLANPEDYVSQLVVVKNGTFAAGSFNTNSASNINFTQNGSTIAVRNAFKTVSATFAAGTEATVVGLVTIYNSAVQLYPRNNNDIVVAGFPLDCNFDGAGAFVWSFANGDNANKWYVGKAQGFDNGKLYISSSNGYTNKYNVSSASVTHAYIPVTLPASDVQLSFDLRTVGDANDYVQVALMDEVPVAGTLPTEYLARYQGVSEFTTETLLIPAENAGEKYLVFTWNNNASGGTQQPAAIDNVKLYSVCTQVSNVAATVTGQTAVVTWTAPAGQTAWTVEYKDVNDNAWQSVYATTPSVTLNNLATSSSYDVRVRANCGANDNSAWVNGQFTVPCIDGTMAPADVEIGTGTTANYIAPMNSFYKNSWTQMIYPASEFTEAGYINSLSWYVNATNAHNYQTLKIYLGTTTASTHATTSDWVSMDNLTLVYESNNGTMGSTVGWETYEFDTPFYYTPGQNLVVVTARTADNYKSLNYRYTSVTDAVLYRRSDSSPEDYGSHPGTNTGVKNNNLPNMIVSYTDDCHDLQCAAPTGLTYENVTTNSATIKWAAGDATSWRVNYKSSEEETWHHADVTTNTYNMANLDQDAAYTVTVMANCGTIGMSDEATATFTTLAECQVPTNLTVEHHVANSIVTWVGISGVNAYEVQYAENGATDWNTATVTGATTFILGNLTEGTSYKVRVRSICGQNLNSEWTNTLTFTRPVYCAVPTSITSVTTNNQVTLTWAEGFGTSWTVEYGEDGFTLGEGTQITTNTNTVTITGLDANTDYDVYVKANCGDYPGNWSTAHSFKTECDPLTVTAAMPWFEDFEGYTGSGQQPFVCWLTPVKPNGPFVYCNYAQSCYSGYNSAELKGSTNVLVLPAFTNDIHTLGLSFWATATNTSLGQVEVGVLTDVNDMSTFEVVGTAGTPGARGTTSGIAGNGNYMGPFYFTNVNATAGRIALRYTNTNASASWNLDDFTVFIPQDCPAPVGITADVNADAGEASISWTPFGEETAWQVQYGETGFALGTGTIVTETTTNYMMTSLTEGTSYDVYVRAICSATENSVWAGPYTFEMPGACEQYCTYTINLTDSYGDGWNGGTLTVSQNGEELGSYTISSGSSASYTVDLCSGVDAVFTYTAGSYAYENSWVVLDANGDQAWSASGSGMSSGGTLTENVTPNCGGCANSCEYTINLTDSYGDGWNGGTLTVSQNGEELGSYTISSGSSASYTVELCSGVDAVFTYTAGSYAYENSWVVLDANGAQAWSANGSGMSSGGTLTQNVTPSCGSAPVECTTTCAYTLELEDSYGDGWNGGTLSVMQAGTTVSGSYTIESGTSATYTVDLCSGVDAVFTYTPGSYADENSFVVKDQDGTTVWSYSGSDGAGSHTVTPNCGGAGPTPCENSCDYVFVLTDSYGDGWSGSYSGDNIGSLDIEQNGALVQTLTLSTGSSQTYNVALCNGQEVTLTLHPDYYSDEMGLTVYDAAGAVIWTLDASGFYGYGYDDDEVFTFTPACVACDAPTELVVDEVSNTSVTLSWTGADSLSYIVYYKNLADNDWTTTTVTGTTVTLTLSPNTTYLAKVKAACDNFGNFTNEVMFFSAPAAACGDHTISAQNGNGYYTPVNDFYKNSRSEQIFTPEEVGAAGAISKIYFNYQGSSTMTKKTNVKIYLGHTTKSEFASTSDWTTTGLTLVYTGHLNCSTGWNEFELDNEFSYNGTDNLIVVVDDESGQYGSSSNKFYYTNCTGYKCLTYQNDSYTWSNHSNPTGTRRTYRSDIRFYVCAAATDLALTGIHNIPNGCDLSNIPVTIDVKVTGESNVSSIKAYYRINDGATVQETITLSTPLAHNDVYTYTFNTMGNFPLDVNNIEVWVEIANDGNVANNMLTAGPIENIDPASIPFVETFNAGEINDGWFVRDVNGDNVTFNIANGVASYSYSDEVAANDWLMTTCMNLYKSYYSWSPYVYEVSYTYKANDPTMEEKFSVYYGTKDGDEYVMNHELASHVFSNGNYVTVRKYFTVPQSGTYYFGIHATSAPGNAGFQINDFSVKEAVSFTVYADLHGSVEPEGDLYVADGDEVTLTITPDFGYHVEYIFNYYSGEFLRGENTDNATVEYFTFTPEDGDDILISFTANKYEVNASVENLIATGYNNNAPGATYTPDHQVVAHGGSHTGVITVAEHYHIIGVTVNGMDVTSSLTALGNNQYQLNVINIYENKNINVVVGLDDATIIYTVLDGQGTINNEFVVDANTVLPATYTVTLDGYSSLLSTIVPAPGYHVASIIINGVEHTNIESYYFNHLFDTNTVVITFAKNHYVITTAGFGNGTVSAGVEFDYDPDITYNFSATPAAGYRIGTLTRNNVALNVTDPAVGYTETLTNILDNYNYEVMFVPNSYTITATCGNNGTISPIGAASYLYHQNAVYNINAAQGYYIASVTVDGTTTNYTQVDALTSTTYTFSNVEADHTISATFAQMMFEITVNAGTNGTIAPATSSYGYGATPTFTITPNPGYSIVDVTVDGASIGAVSTYTFPALTAAHTIAATFTANSYTITATAGNGGTITPAGATTVAYNANQTYTIAAGTGYHVSNVYVDGASVGAVTTYTFSGVTENHTIYAAFDLNEYTVTVNQPAHGTITPGTTTVLYGATPSFVITPATGYTVSAITVNGSNVALANVPNVNGTYTYTFAAINANQTLTATMTAKTYTITASAGANGSITPNGNTTVNYGAAQAYVITPANGYVVDQVTVDGMSIGAPTSYTFTNVVANHTINATFKLAECEAPSFLYTTHIDDASAVLHWSHPTATSFNIQYKTPTSNFTIVNGVSGNSYQLTGLNENTTYMWQVQAICTGNNHSDWANLVYFTTDNTTIDNTGIEDLVKNNIKVYAEHQNVHIINNEGMNIDNVRIFDAYGKLIYSGSVNTTHEVINLNVATGTYIVNVATEQGVANYKVTIMK